MIRMKNGTDSLCHNEHRCIVLYVLLSACLSTASVLQIQCRKTVVKHGIPVGCFAIALAMASRCFCPPDTLASSLSNTTVHICRFFVSMNSSAWATCAASIISCITAVRISIRSVGTLWFRRTRTPFCGTYPNLLSQIYHGNIPDIFAILA